VPSTGTLVAGVPLTLSASAGAGVDATVTIPAGALPAGTVVSVYPVDDRAALSRLLEAGQAYVVAFGISWRAPNGTSPTASAPITMVVHDPSITAGDTIYELTTSGLADIGSATDNGAVTIAFTSDPVFVVARVTARQLSLQDHRSVTIIGYDRNAEAGSKVSVNLMRSRRIIKRATVKVGSKHRFFWTSAKLTTATYTVNFRISEKLAKTTTINVAKAPGLAK
jgi:hypothetical protein